ncbi:hypothetical protein AAC387_Pa08g1332 [Persea americana]
MICTIVGPATVAPLPDSRKKEGSKAAIFTFVYRNQRIRFFRDRRRRTYCASPEKEHCRIAAQVFAKDDDCCHSSLVLETRERRKKKMLGFVVWARPSSTVTRVRSSPCKA